MRHHLVHHGCRNHLLMRHHLICYLLMRHHFLMRHHLLVRHHLVQHGIRDHLLMCHRLICCGHGCLRGRRPRSRSLGVDGICRLCLSSSRFTIHFSTLSISHGHEAFVWRLSCGMYVLSVRPTFEAVAVAPGNPLMTPPGAGARGLSGFVALAYSVDLPPVNLSVLQMTNMFTQYIADKQKLKSAHVTFV